MYRNLPLTAQTTYAQLLEAVLARELRRTARSLSGSFSAKKVGKSTYWYYSYRLPDAGVQQVFIGPDSDRMRALIEESKKDIQADSSSILVKAYSAMGGSLAISQQVSLLQHLADAGLFRAGAVLAGTQAFLSYANVLGAKWKGRDQTSDVDLGWSDKHVSIVLPTAPKIDINDALTTFENGFVPSFIISKGLSAAYHSKSDSDFRVDFLTTLSKGANDVRTIEALNVNAQALPFMEFSLEEPIQTVFMDQRGRSVLVNIPPPARFALHKLIVTELRTDTFKKKVAKDLAQAATLLEWFADHEPEAIAEARQNAIARGPAWRRNLQGGWARLERAYPDVASRFADAFKASDEEQSERSSSRTIEPRPPG